MYAEIEENPLTKTLKPVTEAKELPKEAPERGSFPRWPTNIIDISCKLNCSRLTAISGTDRRSCNLTSLTISSLRQQHCSNVSEWSSCWFEVSGVSRFDLPALSIVNMRTRYYIVHNQYLMYHVCTFMCLLLLLHQSITQW